MALKKGDRAQVTAGPTTYYGFISKGGAKATMVLDNGRQQISRPMSQFVPSNHPIPDDSPFKNVFVEKGVRVEFDDDGRLQQGIVISGDVFSAKVRNASMEYNVPQHMLKKSSVPVPVDPPGPMDAWSVRKYKAVAALSEETVAFSAEILYEGKKVLDAKNNGHGGCNIYYGPFEMQQKFAEDAKAWAMSFGDEKPFESDDEWVGWAGEEKPLGITATEHFADRLRSRAEFEAQYGSPNASPGM